MCNNWYKIAKLQQEAGLQDMLPTAVIGALLAVMAGSTIWSAAQRFNVEPEKIESAMENPQTIDMLKNINNEKQISPQLDATEKQNKTELTEKQKLQKNIIARTIYAEGRSEPQEGLKAIASVIFNRSNGTPESMVDKIKIPKHFSCWNAADDSDWVNMKQGKGQAWDASSELAESMVKGSFQPSGTWNHYYNPRLADPSWAYTDKSRKQLRPYTAIGDHHFIKI